MARQGHRGVAEMLLQINPKCMDATNASGDTCLHYATISEVNAVFFFLNAVCVCVCARAHGRTGASCTSQTHGGPQGTG